MRNSVRLFGRLGIDPELTELDGGKKRVRFTLATNDQYKNAAGEKVEQTEWHSVVGWGKVADIASQYLSKGKEVAIEGKLVHRSYETKEGETKYVSEVQLNELLMVGGK